MADTPDRPSGQDPFGTATGEHATTRVDPGRGQDGPPARRSLTARAAAARRRTVGVLATAVSAATTLVVAILAVHIVFVAFEANTANGIVQWFGDRAHELCWQFKDVFQPSDPKLEVAVNYGLAAVVYLVGGRIVVALVRRLA
ncbi:hypothetical protein [Actinomadura chibensis]|uniref:Uncharacterized protein n=1 Tax=Actinomadura chibensis TaxID=392828 RepID=A0A5D0NP39_9ACTN|nr:hypothetical protein [Actinomadura chibensis]TYB46105.1 hypothetical protein FXF69_12425 [Actinomadura chibensis]